MYVVPKPTSDFLRRFGNLTEAEMRDYLLLRGWQKSELYQDNWLAPGAAWHSSVYRTEAAVAAQARLEFATAATIRNLVAKP
jgi:hypothetical protein